LRTGSVTLHPIIKIQTNYPKPRDSDCLRVPACYGAGVTTLLLATRNARKVEEIRAILSSQFQFYILDDFPGAPPVVEDADTFAGNAMKKAIELAKWVAARHELREFAQINPGSRSARGDSRFFVLADDSGLEVDALKGAPGVHSARFAAMDSAKSGNTADSDNNVKLLRLLKEVPAEKRTARFRCALALVPVEPRMPGVESRSPVCYANEIETRAELFDGVCEGGIIFEPRGQNGFGYDPLFVPEGFDKTFAELGDAVKNKLSHRAQALEKLRIYLGKVLN
jgi:XTP/dITP diphosphohydrolase